MSKNTSVVKYAAIASAVAAACGASYGWAAGTIYVGTPVSSGLNANIAAATTADMVGTAGGTLFSVRTADTTYSVNDVITLTFAGASLRTTNAITPVGFDCSLSATGSTVVLGYLNKTSSTVTYRVLGTGNASITNGTVDRSNEGLNCNFPANQYSIIRNTATTVGASSVTVNYRANQGGETGVTFDQTLSRGPWGVVNQFTAGVSVGNAFSGTVDVNAARLAWTGPAVSRDLVLSVTHAAPAAYNSAYFASEAQTTHTFNIVGSGNGTESAFSFLNDDGGDCTAADLTAGAGTASVTSAAGSLSISANCATLTVSGSGFIGASGAAASKEFTVSLAKSSATTGLVIADGSFTVSPSFSVTIVGTSVQSASSFAGGSFGINGLVATIPYMPYGVSGTSAITQAYYITNRSASAGAVTGVAYNEAGTSCNLGTVGTANARSVTNLSTNINDKINACYSGNQRVYVTLTSATPAASTEVQATYRVGNDSRVNVFNDSYKTYSR